MTLPVPEQVSPHAVRRLLDNLRRRPPALLAGCGCALPVSAVTLRDFEEAVIFHIQTQWSLAIGGPGKVSDLDQLIDAIGRLSETGDNRQRILRELHDSLLSYAQRCSVHGFRAELTG